MGSARNSFVRCATWVIGLIVGTGLAQAQEEVVFELHDLRAIHSVDRWSPTPVDWRPHLESAFLDRLSTEAHPVPLEDAVTAERLFDSNDLDSAIRWYLGDDWPDEMLTVILDTEILSVRGTPASQERISEFLSILERRALRTATLEALVLPAEALGDEWNSVLAPDEVTRLLASASPLARSRARVPLGRVANLGATSVRAVLHDFDVEVATFAAVADPQVTIVFEGTQIGAVVRELAEGGLLLRTWGRRGFVHEPPREVELEYLDGTTVQLPKMATSRAAASARIADGGGLLLGHTENGDGVWLVTARRVDESGTEDRMWIPLGGLTARPMTSPPPWIIGPEPSGGFWRPPSADPLGVGDHGVPSIDEDGWFAVLAEALELEDPDSHLTVLDGDLVVRKDAALAGRVRQLVREWGAPMSRTVEVDLRYGQLDAKVGETIARGELNAAELVPRLEMRLQGACRLGDSLTVQGGEEEYYLKDFDIEIAQGAVIGDPIIDNFFQGIAFWCYPTMQASGEILALVELEFQEQLGDWQREDISFGNLAPTDAEGEPQDLPPSRAFIEVTSSTRADLSLVIRPVPGEWMLVACHSLSRTERTFVAVLRMEVR